MRFTLLGAGILAALMISPAASADELATSPSAMRAQSMLQRGSVPMLKRAAADRFVAQDVVVDRKGNEHVRFARTYRGLPVIGGGIVVHSRNGGLESVTQTMDELQRPGIVPSVDRRKAISAAGAHFDVAAQKAPTTRLVVYARGEATPALAYEVRYVGVKKDQTPTDMRFIVDAHTGQLLDKWDTIHTAGPGRDPRTCDTASSGTGTGLYVGQVELGTAQCSNGRYQLTDPSRGGGRTTNMSNRKVGLGAAFVDSDNVWGTGTNSSSQTVGVDAHYGVSMTWDYYDQIHGRSGIADDGQGALSRVHFGRNYANAFWSDACFCMTFGDGNGSSVTPLVELDVAGHEMSHGVTSRTANLIYSGESGGLNEATSDIFGAMVEYFAGNPSDPGDYLIGELVFRQDPNLPYQTALRYMFKPSLDGLSADCWSPDVGGMDVHYSSGVANHFFYLLAEGAVVPDGWGAGTGADLATTDMVCNGDTSLAGIGREAAEKIWYLALTGYMVEDTDYAGARVATLNAATDLYGAESAEYAAVAATWSAVSVE
ncbi:M4 family metallopeptidase [Lysobacter sp. F60174L2]|uniref:M4 family metallopeptidase n=1 Tax=Lysobacter sp. F60174L2 TaxID=3459295 RepID=UPI00403DC4E0